MPRVYEEKSFEAFETWKSRLNDAATVIPSVWSVRTLSNDELAKASTCITGKTGVTGIVTTNATLYSQGPPTLNTTTNQLDYKVATAHYEPDGKTEFKGTYDLLIREDVADCLYGLSKTLAASGSAYSEEAPYVAEAKYAGPDSMTTEERDPEDVTLEEAIAEATDTDLGETDTEDVFDEDATIAAVDADVTTSTGATPVTRPNESISMENGWFKFSASNFTFSAPTVKVKVGVRPASTIWCASYLASLKKVTAVSPKCPAGLSKASVRHCVKGASVTAAIAVKPSCPSGFRTAKAITCAKGMSAKRIIAASPKCPAGFTAVRSVKCVKGNTARVVTAVRPTCANGFRAATTIACRRGTTRLTVTDVKPTCPKGFRRT